MQLIHIVDAVALIGLSAYRLRELIDGGDLPHQMVGGRTYIPRSALDDFARAVIERWAAD